MTTNSPTNPRQPDATETPPEKKKFDLSLTQTIGGALAAMTAATIGSRLGVAGTIVGAALASIVAAVSTTLYTASLQTTQSKVKTVWSGRVAKTDPISSGDPTASAAGDPADTETRVLVDLVPPTPSSAAPASAWDTPQPPAAPAAQPPKRQLPWKHVLGGALVAFAIAAIALTGFELLTGRALSGGQGTTIQQVTEPRQPVTTPSRKATPSETASPSETATPTPSASATPTPSETPVAPVPSATPSETPTQVTPSETPSTATPSASATPSAGDTPAAG